MATPCILSLHIHQAADGRELRLATLPGQDPAKIARKIRRLLARTGCLTGVLNRIESEPQRFGLEPVRPHISLTLDIDTNGPVVQLLPY